MSDETLKDVQKDSGLLAYTGRLADDREYLIYKLQNTDFVGSLSLAVYPRGKFRSFIKGMSEPVEATHNPPPVWAEYRQHTFFYTKRNDRTRTDVCPPGTTVEKISDPKITDTKAAFVVDGFRYNYLRDVDDAVPIKDEKTIRRFYEELLHRNAPVIVDRENHIIKAYPSMQQFTHTQKAGIKVGFWFACSPFWEAAVASIAPEEARLKFTPSSFAQRRHGAALRPWTLSIHAKPLQNTRQCF